MINALDGAETATKPVVTPEQAAAYAVNRAAAIYGTCVTATATGASVAFVMNDCTGPYGLVHVTGTLTVVYSVGASSYTGTATATDLHVNGATVDISATAVYTPGTTKTLAVTTAGAGTGALGHTITRNGSYTLSWTTTCVTLNGTWTTTIDLVSWNTAVTDLTRCLGACPAAGGQAVFHGPVRTVTIDFDGSDVAAWHTAAGLTGTVDLVCTPAT